MKKEEEEMIIDVENTHMIRPPSNPDYKRSQWFNRHGAKKYFEQPIFQLKTKNVFFSQQ